jgi:hypothetical protein
MDMTTKKETKESRATQERARTAAAREAKIASAKEHENEKEDPGFDAEMTLALPITALHAALTTIRNNSQACICQYMDPARRTEPLLGASHTACCHFVIADKALLEWNRSQEKTEAPSE